MGGGFFLGNEYTYARLELVREEEKNTIKDFKGGASRNGRSFSRPSLGFLKCKKDENRVYGSKEREGIPGQRQQKEESGHSSLGP